MLADAWNGVKRDTLKTAWRNFVGKSN
jgi:hypothetical protein